MAQPRLLERRLGSGKRVETNHGGASKRSAELGADHVDFGRGVKARRYASMGGSSNRPVQDGAKELEGDVKRNQTMIALTSPSSSFAPS
jgi:hypothetical protein